MDLSWLASSLATLSPCVFPIAPLVLGGAAQGNRLAPLAMGLGMALSFAGIGVAHGALGPALGTVAGFALTLVAVAYASRRGFQSVRDKVLLHGARVKKVLGGLIFLAGVAIATGADKWLEAQVLDHLPDVWLRLMHWRPSPMPQ